MYGKQNGKENLSTPNGVFLFFGCILPNDNLFISNDVPSALLNFEALYLKSYLLKRPKFLRTCTQPVLKLQRPENFRREIISDSKLKTQRRFRTKCQS